MLEPHHYQGGWGQLLINIIIWQLLIGFAIINSILAKRVGRCECASDPHFLVRPLSRDSGIMDPIGQAVTIYLDSYQTRTVLRRAAWLGLPAISSAHSGRHAILIPSKEELQSQELPISHIIQLVTEQRIVRLAFL